MKPDSYNDQLDDLAKEAMKCILTTTYQSPSLVTEMLNVASKNQRSLAAEIAHRSYEMATFMLKTRKIFLSKNDND